MLKETDITGNKYNKLTAIRFDHNTRSPCGNNVHYWLFRCDCGKEKVIRKAAVIYGLIKSCGCITEERDISGKKFNHLTAIRYDHKNKRGSFYWLFKCDCGKEKVMNKGQVVSGYTKTCGCSRIGTTAKHKLSNSAIYSTWANIKQRCYNKNNPIYKNYGARGITMCDTWKNDFMSFYHWAINNGYKRGLSIDRIDNNGNYCPENCRWATDKEQMRNTRFNNIFSCNGETHCMSEWAELSGVKLCVLQSRLRYGWSIEEALGISIRKRKRRRKIIN